MNFLFELLSTVGIFVLALFILVLFHELGHFLTAKLFKMKVERFSIGFPPRVAGVQIGETDYCVSATPLGGYVKIAGMIDESMDTEYINQEPKPWEFRSKPVWQRSIVISAGVIFNLILAAVIFANITFFYGEQVIPAENVESIYVPEESLAAEVGFKTGDKLIAVNNKDVEYYRDYFEPSELTSSTLSYTVLRDGEEVTLKMPKGFLDQMANQGFLNLGHAMPSIISEVQESMPAGQAGLQAGDKVVAINGEPVSYWLQMTEKIQNSKSELTIQVDREGELLTMNVAPNENQIIGVRPVDPLQYFQTIQLNPGLGESLVDGVVETKNTAVGIVQGLGQLLSGSISVKQNLGGPVAIASYTKDITDQAGVRGFWQITAFLSVTLAIMNILPIPALDGGHLMFLIYEGITRREPSVRIRMALQQIGFIILVGLIIFVTFNDILRELGY
ncbi:MAG: RIP metalloprotease RseP [Bacteroidota bacterium]